jgi:hypothetical protein
MIDMGEIQTAGSEVVVVVVEEEVLLQDSVRGKQVRAEAQLGLAECGKRK